MAPAYRYPRPRTPTGTRRNPENELYDKACQLLEAAQGLRRAAALPDSAPAVTATLGCLEAALDQLAAAADGLGRAADADRRDEPELEGLFERLRLQFGLAQSTCGAAREAAAHARADWPRAIA